MSVIISFIIMKMILLVEGKFVISGILNSAKTTFLSSEIK